MNGMTIRKLVHFARNLKTIWFSLQYRKKSGKDNSGEYVFVKNGNGQPKLDKKQPLGNQPRLAQPWYTQVGHKLRFSLVLINDSCVVQVRNSTLLLTFTPCSPWLILTEKIAIYAPLEYILDIFAFTFLSFRTTVRNLSFCCPNHHHYRKHCIRNIPQSSTPSGWQHQVLH